MDDYTRPRYGRSALLTIDMQRDFLSEAPTGVAGTTEVVPAVRGLVEAYRATRRPIVHVVRLYLPDGSNADLSRRAALAAGAEIVHPGSVGSQLALGLINSELDEHLRRHDVDTVVVAGCNYPSSPRGTVFGASERDYRITVATDAVSGWNDAATCELTNLGVATDTGPHIAHQLQQLARTDR